MKLFSALSLVVLGACQASSSGAPRLAVDSGLEQVTIVSKGLE